MLFVRRLIYLLTAFPLGALWFTIISTLVSTGISIAIFGVGLVMLIATVYVMRWMAQAERLLIRRLLDVEVTAEYRTTTDPRRWPRLQARMADPQTWKDLVYLVLQLPLGAVSFVLTVVLLTVPIVLLGSPLFFLLLDEVDLQATGISQPVWFAIIASATLAGAPIAWLCLRAIEGLGWIHGQWARYLLASTPDPVLQAQVIDARSAQARILSAADSERRRIERDLHDGAQQRLVSLSLKLGMAASRLDIEDDTTAQLIAEAHAESKLALHELRDLARGIHPAILTDRGLAPALEELAGRATTPTRIAAVPPGRQQAEVEAAAYFVVAECLANVDKYATATAATVIVSDTGDALDVRVSDDGRGGADPAGGTGLRGLADRVGALGGTLTVTSASEGGTDIHAVIPLTAAG